MKKFFINIFVITLIIVMIVNVPHTRMIKYDNVRNVTPEYIDCKGIGKIKLSDDEYLKLDEATRGSKIYIKRNYFGTKYHIIKVTN